MYPCVSNQYKDDFESDPCVSGAIPPAAKGQILEPLPARNIKNSLQEICILHARNVKNPYKKYVNFMPEMWKLPARNKKTLFRKESGQKLYSVVGLVLPRGEEQISGPSALSKFKKTSKRSQKGPMSCQKYSKLCYDHFGGRLEASNPPPLFPLQESEAYWTVSSFFWLHRISFHQAHSISHFLANHISAELMAEVWQN